MSVDFQRTTWRYGLEDRILHNHRYENLKSYLQTTGSIFKQQLISKDKIKITTVIEICGIINLRNMKQGFMSSAWKYLSTFL
jgi:hypothetical protein